MEGWGGAPPPSGDSLRWLEVRGVLARPGAVWGAGRAELQSRGALPSSVKQTGEVPFGIPGPQELRVRTCGKKLQVSFQEAIAKNKNKTIN